MMSTTYGILPTDYNYYGQLSGGGMGYNTDTTAFIPGGIQGVTTDLSLGNNTGSWMDALGGYQGIQGMLGAGQLGLGFLGYLDNKKTAELQRNLLGQQIDTNQFLLNQAKNRQADIAKAFGGSTPQGLAANTAARKVL